MATYAKNTLVTQKLPTPISGVVLSFDVDQETGTVQHLVGWSDDLGDHSRYFSGDELELTPVVDPVV